MLDDNKDTSVSKRRTAHTVAEQKRRDAIKVIINFSCEYPYSSFDVNKYRFKKNIKAVFIVPYFIFLQYLN